VSSVGAIPAENVELRQQIRSPSQRLVDDCLSLESATVTAPHYIGEDKSEMRGIKPGWYAIEDDGNISSGSFPSRQECVKRITQPTNGTMVSKLRQMPN
jgi:hypothetical protein